MKESSLPELMTPEQWREAYLHSEARWYGESERADRLEQERDALHEENRYLRQAVRIFLTAPNADERLEAQNVLLSLAVLERAP